MNTTENLASHKSECGKAHGLNWMKALGHLAGKPNIAGFEIGTFKGESAEWFLENIFTHPESRFYCIDPFTGNVEHAIGKIDCSNLEKESEARLKRFTNVTIIKDYSQHILPKFIHEHQTFDFCYIDGSHDAASVMRDSALAFEVMKVGGVMIWDDYPWNVREEDFNRPKIAIDAFLKCYAPKLRVFGTGWQVAAERTA